MGPRPLGPRRNRWTASKLLTDHLIIGLPLKSEPVQEKWFSQTIHTYKPFLFAWVVIFMKHILNVMES